MDDMGDQDIKRAVRDRYASHATAGTSCCGPKETVGCGCGEGTALRMMCAATGLARCGKVPFVSTFAIFGSGKTWTSEYGSADDPDRHGDRDRCARQQSRSAKHRLR